MMPFKKGQSGNPGGRPREVAHVRELARKHAASAVNALVSIMKDKKVPASSRIAAANAILDRGYGRVPPCVEPLLADAQAPEDEQETATDRWLEEIEARLKEDDPGSSA